VMARDGVTESAARRRMAAQMPIAEKRTLADYVIDTSGTFADTDTDIDQVLASLRVRASRAESAG
jgi:dephospho-CoA kinase